MAVTQAKDKYYLRSLHEEIGLYDRKLAHLLKYDTFATDKERDTAAAKLTSKRELLVRNARLLVEEGIEFRPSDLPRSLRPEDQPDEALPPAAEKQLTPDAAKAPIRPSEPFSESAVLNFRNEINAYIEKRRKTSPTAAATA